jgi:DNA-directed RNA polymerase specialized sigma24 family protein
MTSRQERADADRRTDAAFVERLRAGEDARDDAARHFHPRLVAQIRSRLGSRLDQSEPDDLAQACWLVFVEKYDPHAGRSIWAYLMGIAGRLLKKRLASGRRRPVEDYVEAELCDVDAPTPADEAADRELLAVRMRVVRQALAGMTARRREAFLAKWNPDAPPDWAKQLELRLGTPATRFTNAAAEATSILYDELERQGLLPEQQGRWAKRKAGTRDAG